MLNRFVAALIEAWDEVRLHKIRVVMSLVAVVAAVTAMTSVVAVGEMVSQSEKESTEAWIGRAVTITYEAIEKGGDGDGTDFGFDESALAPTGDAPESGTVPLAADEPPIDPVGSAFKRTMERFEVPFWSRFSEVPDVKIREVDEVTNQGTFHGVPVESVPEWGAAPMMRAVDPGYTTIFRLNMVQGRWFVPEDANNAVVPVILNEPMWKFLGHPVIEGDIPVMLHLATEPATALRVIGVASDGDPYASETVFVPYEAAAWLPQTAGNEPPPPSLRVWLGEDAGESTEVRDGLRDALGATLGSDYEVTASSGDEFVSAFEFQNVIRTVMLVIGFIVISLGALGLLNVAMVTVRQRIREIGVRRALGASARRIFFTVMFESVAATVVAGIVGVMLSVILLRLLPPELFGMPGLQDAPPFPVFAALAGLGVSTLVGALCGLIPAIMAVRVRPIDAIRY